MHHLRRSLLWLTFFSIAMGFLESAVVIYLRELYYPDGFRFPLVLMPHKMALTELIREAATMIMLGSIGILAGRNTAQRFSFFIYSFAVWDLFYYVFLKLILDWPESFFTWDILFLIPVPWVGPVIAPCIVSFSMIILTMIIIIAAEKEQHVRVNLSQWLLLIAGAFIIIFSFIWDYLRYMNGRYVIWTPVSEHEMFYEISGYIPQSFNWTLFIGGEILILTSIISIFLSIHKAKQKKLPAAI